MDLNHIFQFHLASPAKAKKYETLRAAFKEYAEVLISDHDLTEDYDLKLELAYEDIIRAVSELVPMESPEYYRALHYINEAYDMAINPKQSVVQAVQAASMFSNAAIALHR